MQSMMDGGNSNSDSGSASGACADLLACCSQVPAQLQGLCMQAAQSGDTARCMMILGIAAQLGVMCMGGSGDAGPPVDAGPLGPNCSAYLACCPSLGPAQMLCETQANMGNEANCARELAAAQMLGQCGGDGGLPSFDGSIPDIGPFDIGPFDFGPFDVGSGDSAPASDASTAGDAAPPDA